MITLLPQQFNVNEAGVDCIRELGDMLHVAYVAGGAIINYTPGATYRVDSRTYYATANGVDTEFDVTGIPVRWTDNVETRVREDYINNDPTIGPLANDNSGYIQRPYIDFELDILREKIVFKTPPKAIYRPDGSLELNTIKIDIGRIFQGSNFTLNVPTDTIETGSARWIIAGAPTTNGQDRPIKNITFNGLRNRAVGDASCPKLPLILWADGINIVNPDKEGLTGSSLQLSACVNYAITGVRNVGAVNGAIGVLLFHCQNGTVDEIDQSDLGGNLNKWLFVIQIKGGENNIVTNSRILDCSGSGLGGDSGGMLRGDAPWEPTYILGRYPYIDGNWNSPDAQRATRNSWIKQSSITYSLNYTGPKLAGGGLMQEFIGGGYDTCTTTRAGMYKATSLVGGSEANPSLLNISGDSPTVRVVQLQGQPTNPLVGAVVDGINATNCNEKAVFGSYVDSPTIRNVSVADSNTAVDLVNCGDVDLEGVVIARCQTGILISSGTTSKAASKLRSINSGAITPFTITSPCDIREGDSVQPIATKTTTSIATTSILSFPLVVAANYNVELTIIALVGAVVNRFKLYVPVGVVSNNITVGSPTYTENTNPSGLSGVVLVGGSRFTISGKGKANTPVTWNVVEAVFTKV